MDASMRVKSRIQPPEHTRDGVYVYRTLTLTLTLTLLLLLVHDDWTNIALLSSPPLSSLLFR